MDMFISRVNKVQKNPNDISIKCKSVEVKYSNRVQKTFTFSVDD